ncbi:MAG: energy transducer TonB [Candidatus Sulfotelmatobacter sp.]
MCLLLASAFSPLAVSIAHSQGTDSLPQPAPYLLNLYPPVYPPLARQARIAGDVILRIGVRPDGSVASAEVISGHAMLKQAALDSAQKSAFGCRECGEAVTLVMLTYTFEIRGDCRFGPNCEALEFRAPEVTQSHLKVAITAEPTCTCDPAVTITRLKARCPKCLYLWKCGFRDQEDK